MNLHQSSLAVVFAISILSGCGEKSSSTCGSAFNHCSSTTSTTPVADSNTHREFMTNVVDNIILPNQTNFVNSLATTQQAVNHYCDALTNNTADIESNLKSAQTAWRDSMATWQQIEAIQLTPLLQNDQELRNLIYSWPTTSSCGVDQDVIYHKNGFINSTPYNIDNRSISRRGLDALEYLLFSTDLNHSCSANSGIVADWNNQSEADKTIARCEYAATVTADLTTHANTLSQHWLGTDSVVGFASQFKTAGLENSPFSTTTEAVNLISDALFYIDSMTKDLKIASPLGYFGSCGTVNCELTVESLHSQNSLSNIENNLITLQAVFLGTGSDTASTVGFDDLLLGLTDQETVDSMTANIAQALQTTQQLQGSLSDKILTDNSAIIALHADIKQITDIMKTQFIASLALDLPATSAGDND
ncbi:imelysin family protein [Algibacillus agarilyticus]|uniref:imelysin family protein n=1 Tax=Algibacillus agarilyticus TaxID=2234133 RepID=UPI000DCF870E|nr:imelysin family protein [Algibacillus agarilyticus]